jgi:hypothetical protein
MDALTLSEEELELLLKHVLEWHVEVDRDNWSNFCPECGWDSKHDGTKFVHGRAVLDHKPDCKWARLLERLKARDV